MFHRIRHLIRLVHSKLRERNKRTTRSPAWRKLEKAVIKADVFCASCNSTDHLQVHHISPFHLHPEAELLIDNLIVLCMSKEECHLHVGHAGSWRKFNPDVKKDCELLKKHPERRSILVETIRSR